MKLLRQAAFLMTVFAVFGGSTVLIKERVLNEPDFIVATNDRAPNSIQKIFDYSDLKGSALETAARERLLNSIHVVSGQDFAIQMGNFVMQSEAGQKDFACGYYNKVTFEFEADGVLVEGEKPTMHVEAGCDVAQNINFMAPFKIPVSKLKNQKPGQGQLKFYEGGEAVTVSVNHAPISWPTTWKLKSVKMTHTGFTARVLNINADQNQIGMKW